MSMIYRCPPLLAWISAVQCQRNADLAHRAHAQRPGSDLRVRAMRVLDTCLGCPGVVALGAGTREIPELRSAPRAIGPRRKRRVHVGHGFLCPDHLITVDMLARDTGLSRSNVWHRLRQSGLRPEQRAEPARHLPALYPREEALAACQPRRKSA